MVWPWVLPSSAAVGRLGPGVAAAVLGAAEPPALAAGWLAADVAAALGAVDAPPLEHAEATTATPAINPSNRRVLILLSPPPRNLRSHRVRDGQIVLSLPYQPDSLALQRERLGRGRRKILPSDNELRP